MKGVNIGKQINLFICGPLESTPKNMTNILQINNLNETA